MRLRSLVLCSLLAAAALAVRASASSIQLGVAPMQTAGGSGGPGLEAQIRSRIEDLCDPVTPGSGSPGLEFYNPDVRSRCVTVNNAILDVNGTEEEGSAGGPSLSIATVTTRPDGSLSVTGRWETWSVLGSRLVSSSCGRWRYAAALDPAVSPPSGDLTLWPAAGDPSRGVFSGTIPLAARLHLENVDRGTAYDLPLRIDAALRGSWIAPSSAPFASPLPQGASNLRLYLWPVELWWLHHPECREAVASWREGDALMTMYCDRCVGSLTAPALPGSPLDPTAVP